jgi:hypothetical protein
MEIRSYNNRFLTKVIFTYLLTLFVAGSLNRWIQYYDLFIPIFFFYILFYLKFLKKSFLYLNIILISYTIGVGIFSLIAQYNTWLTFLATFLRGLSFLIMIAFGYLFNQIIIKKSYFFFPIIILIVFIKTVINLILDVKPYYGYVDFPSTIYPSQVGVSLVSILIFLIIIKIFNKQPKTFLMIKNIFIYLLFFLVLFINTRTSFISTFICLVFISIIYFFLKKNLNKKLFLCLSSFLILILLVFLEDIIKIFPRINPSNIVDQFNYRIEKSNTAINFCQNFACKLFGTGAGSHSLFNDALSEGFLSLDNLYVKFYLEFGYFGTLIWFLFFLNILFKKRYDGSKAMTSLIISAPVLVFLLLGALLSAGSEFIFISYGGQMYALFLGTLYGFYEKKNI